MFVHCRAVAVYVMCVFFFFKQKTAYEMRISDWSSDVCSSDLLRYHGADRLRGREGCRSRISQTMRPRRDPVQRSCNMSSQLSYEPLFVHTTQALTCHMTG